MTRGDVIQQIDTVIIAFGFMNTIQGHLCFSNSFALNNNKLYLCTGYISIKLKFDAAVKKHLR